MGFPSRSHTSRRAGNLQRSHAFLVVPYPDPVWRCFCNFPVSSVGKVQRDSVFLSGFLSRRSSFLSATPLPNLSRGNWCLSPSLHHQKRSIPEGYPKSTYLSVCISERVVSETQGRSETRQLLGFGVSLPMPAVELHSQSYTLRGLQREKQGKRELLGLQEHQQVSLEHLHHQL